MAEYSRYARNITKGKLPYENWNSFYTEYMGSADRLSRVQFSLNFISLLYTEEVWQEDGLRQIGTEFVELFKKVLDSDYSKDNIEDITLFRAKMKNRMECLVTYTDRYMIYQYVLNCLRYKFDDYDYDDYSDEEFTKELINFITSDRDQSTMKYKTMEVLKSIPIRMTRNRFFEMVSDGFSIYNEGDLDTLLSFDYMIRGAAMTHEPENMESNFPDLYEYSRHFEGLDFDNLDNDQFFVEDITLKECIDFLNNQVTTYDILAQLVNQLYVRVLTSEFADRKSEDYIASDNLAKKALLKFNPEETFEVDEELTEHLVELEGIQEDELEELEEAEGRFEDILQSKFCGECEYEIGLQLDTVDDICKLLSTSYFADLDEENSTGAKVTQADIDKYFADFRAELEPKLKSSCKLLSRAIMAAVIGYLPMNFSNTEELREYIYNSLSACTNLPEKMALVERLEELMNDDEDWD
ncbi:MAG: hypothetical protein K6F92_07695 [Lachnospiraceae bacterium]|nr:hypothetical protein [Lachnospiraceae bacterium]